MATRDQNRPRATHQPASDNGFNAHLNDLNQLQSKLTSYRRLHTEHKDYKIFAGLAGFSFSCDGNANQPAARRCPGAACGRPHTQWQQCHGFCLIA